MKTLLSFLFGIFALCVASHGAPLIQPGDRVAIVGNTFADSLHRYGYLETLVLQRLADTNGKADASFRNLGWAGDTLTQRDRPTNFPTEDETLTEHRADVLLLSFGLSESFAGTAGLEEFKADYQRLIEHYRAQQYNGETAPRLVLLSPLAYEDLGSLTPKVEARNAELAAYTGAIATLARENDLGFVDLYAPTHELMTAKGAPKLTTNGLHLTQLGYWAVSRVLADALVPGADQWRLEIDFASRETAAEGVAIKTADAVSGGLSLKVTESAWPAPAPPAGAESALPASRDLLVVKNLPDAVFTLTVDGETVATASAADWAKGVAIDASPTHREVNGFRESVNDKNRQFIYSWKALNQVHIVGERKSSSSGQALPGEVVEFNELTIARDEKLRDLGDHEQTREWRLIATPEKTTR